MFSSFLFFWLTAGSTSFLLQFSDLSALFDLCALKTLNILPVALQNFVSQIGPGLIDINYQFCENISIKVASNNFQKKEQTEFYKDFVLV